MNTIIKILAMALLVIGLVGCQSSEVPPTPDSPGGVAGEYSVAVEDLGTWANPSVSLTDIKDQLTVNPVRSEDNLSFTIADTAIWNDYYIFNFQTEEWTSRTLSLSDESMLYKNTNWILDTKSITSEENFFSQEGEYLIAYYSCSKDGSWDCHNGWQVEGFNVVQQSVSNASFITSSSGTVEDHAIIIFPEYSYPGYTHYIALLEERGGMSEQYFFNITSWGDIKPIITEYPTEGSGAGTMVNIFEINQSNWNEFSSNGIQFEGYLNAEFDNNKFAIFAYGVERAPINMNDLNQMSQINGQRSNNQQIRITAKYNLPSIPDTIGTEQDLEKKTGLLDVDSNGIENFNDYIFVHRYLTLQDEPLISESLAPHIAIGNEALINNIRMLIEDPAFDIDGDGTSGTLYTGLVINSEGETEVENVFELILLHRYNLLYERYEQFFIDYLLNETDGKPLLQISPDDVIANIEELKNK